MAIHLANNLNHADIFTIASKGLSVVPVIFLLMTLYECSCLFFHQEVALVDCRQQKDDGQGHLEAIASAMVP